MYYGDVYEKDQIHEKDQYRHVKRRKMETGKPWIA